MDGDQDRCDHCHGQDENSNRQGKAEPGGDTVGEGVQDPRRGRRSQRCGSGRHRDRDRRYRNACGACSHRTLLMTEKDETEQSSGQYEGAQDLVAHSPRR